MVSSDFKRIKAKVGKRAPKKLNDTETNFQSTSLHVRKQVVNIHDDNSSGEKGGNKTNTVRLLVSSQGRSISDLSLQLSHPAAAVRRSAAKGIQDAVVQNTSSIIVENDDDFEDDVERRTTMMMVRMMRAHLSELVPVVAKCCIDADGDVRAIGLTVLQYIVNKLITASASSESLSTAATIAAGKSNSSSHSLLLLRPCRHGYKATPTGDRE